MERLSRVLVAFTIEVDDLFEQRFAHRTTRGGGPPEAPWLISLAMYENCLRWLDREGLARVELERRARTGANVDGMRRWRYLRVEGDTLRLTRAGERARDLFATLPAEIEQRWNERFGTATITRLRAALEPHADPTLPDCLPILGYGLRIPPPTPGEPRPADGLHALVARVLLRRALDDGSKLSPAIRANVLPHDGLELREIPRRASISKEAVAMAVGFLEQTGLATLPTEGRFRRLRLTERGARIPPLSLDDDLADALAPFPATPPASPPGTWRAALRTRPERLPAFPVVLHRGGFPDGA